MTKKFYEMERKAYEEFWKEEKMINPVYRQEQEENWWDMFNPWKQSKDLSEDIEAFEGGTTKGGEFELSDYGSLSYA